MSEPASHSGAVDITKSLTDRQYRRALAFEKAMGLAPPATRAVTDTSAITTQQK